MSTSWGLPNISVRQSRPFPRRCGNCGRQEVYPVTLCYTAKMKHDGQVYEIEVPELRIPQCRNCQELIFSIDADDQLVAALRIHLKLLSPEQLQSRRTQLNLTQQELAEQTGIAEEKLSRWESGALIQSRTLDNLLRLYFDCPEARTFLRGLLERDDTSRPPVATMSQFPSHSASAEGP